MIITGVVLLGLVCLTIYFIFEGHLEKIYAVVVLAVFLSAAAIGIAAFHYLISSAFAYLRPKIKDKILKRCPADLSGAWFVGIAPGRSLAIFDGDSSLDLGFLSIEPGRLMFYGDIVEFELKNVQVSDITMQVGSFHFFQLSRVIIFWAHPDINGVQELAIELDDCCRIFGKSRKTFKLFSLLSDWHKDASASSTHRQFEPPPREDEFANLKKLDIPTSGPSCLLNIVSMALTVNAMNIVTDFRANWARPYGKFTVVISFALVAIIYYVVYRQYKNQDKTKSIPSDKK